MLRSVRGLRTALVVQDCADALMALHDITGGWRGGSSRLLGLNCCDGAGVCWGCSVAVCWLMMHQPAPDSLHQGTVLCTLPPAACINGQCHAPCHQQPAVAIVAGIVAGIAGALRHDSKPRVPLVNMCTVPRRWQERRVQPPGRACTGRPGVCSCGQLQELEHVNARLRCAWGAATRLAVGQEPCGPVTPSSWGTHAP